LSASCPSAESLDKKLEKIDPSTNFWQGIFSAKKSGPAILVGLAAFHHHLKGNWEANLLCLLIVFTEAALIFHHALEIAEGSDPPRFVPQS